jgi:hypothetical protein
MIAGLFLFLIHASMYDVSSNQASGLSSVTNKAAPGLKNGMDYVKLGSSDLDVSKGKLLSRMEYLARV